LFVSPAATTNYTVTGTASNGCTNSAEVTVTVLTNPTVTITPAAPDRCAQDPPTTLTASGATTYQWVAGPATANYAVSPTVTTDYVVVGTDAQNPACTNTAIVTVVVRPNPSVPVISQNASPVCPGQTNTIFSVVNQPGVTFTWTLPAEAVSFTGQGTNQISVNWSPTAVAQGDPPIVRNITVTATLNGCNSTADLTIPVTISSPPPAQPQNPAGPSPVCRFSTHTYSVNAVPTASSYDWTNLPAGSFITSGLGTNTVGINWGTAAAGTYTINVAARNSCGVSPPQSIVVVIEQAPAQPGAISLANPPLCSGQPAVYQIAPVAGATSYEWLSSCGWAGTSTTVNITYTPGPTGPCLVSVRAVNACGASAYRTIIQTPGVAPQQPGQINGLARVCTGSIQTYSVQAVAGVTYTWTGVPASATVIGVPTNQITIDWGTTAPGTYTLEVEPTNACGTGPTRSITVEVVDVPGAAPSVSGPSNVCLGSSNPYFAPLLPNVNYRWTITPTTGVVLNSSQNGATVLFQQLGAYTLRVELENECGRGAPFDFFILVQAPPVVSVPVEQVVCVSNPNISASATPTGGTWTCVLCPGGASITGAGLVSGLSLPGERYVFEYTYSDGICPAVRAQTSVLYGVAVGGSAGASATVCAGSNGQVQVTGQVGDVIGWERSTDCVNYSPILNPTTSLTYVNLQQTTCFRAVIRNGGSCPTQTSSAAVITVVDRVVASSVPSVVGTCTDAVTLTGNTALNYSGSWSFISGPVASVNLVNGSGGVANVTGLTTPGSYLFRYTLTNAICGTTTADVVVNRASGVTIANAGLDRTICSNNTVLTGNRPLVGTGTWSYVGGSAAATPVVQTLSNQFGIVTGMTAPGSYIFEWRIVNPDCPLSPSVDQVTIIRDEPPTIADAGPDQVRCASDVLLTGNAPLSGSGSWVFVSGPVVPVLNVFGTSLNATGLTQPGVYIFEWRIVSNEGVCPPSVDQVRVTVVGQPSTATVPKLEYRVCESTGLVLRANAPAVGTGQWQVISQPVGGNAVVTTSGTDGFVTGLSAYGTYEFGWVVSNLPCASSSTAIVTVIRDAQVPGVVSSTPNFKACLNVYPVTVTGSAVPAGYVGEWFYVSGPVANTTITTAGTVGNIINLDLPGFYVFEWRISGPSGSACPSKSSATIVEVEAGPTVADAGSNQTICGDRAVLTGNVPVVGTGVWSIRPPIPVGANPVLLGSGPTVEAVNLTVAGVYTFRYTISSGSGCASSFDEMTVTVSVPGSGGIASADATHCVGSASGSISLSGQVGTIVRWESSAANFSSSSINVFPGTPTLSYSNLTQTTQYRAVVKSGSCPEVYSNVVTITVNQLPTVASAGPDREVCGGTTSVLLNGNVPLVGVGDWYQVSGPGAQVFSLGSSALVAGLTTAGTYTIAYRITNGNCPPSIDLVDIVVSAGSVGGFVSANATVCSGSNSGVLSVFGQVGTVVRWESTTTSFTPGNITAYPGGPTLSYSNLTQTTRYRAVVQSGTCPEALSGEVQIVVVQPPTAADAGPDRQFCGSPLSVSLSGNVPSVGTGSWVLLSRPTGSNASVVGSGPNATLVNPLEEGTYVVEYRITNAPCPASADQAIIQIFNGSDGGTVSASQTVCSGVNAGTLSLSGQKGSVVRWESSTNNFLPGFVTVIPTVLTNYTFSNLTVTTQFRAIVKAGVCPEAASVPATVAVQPPPTVSVAGPNQVACGSVITLSGNQPLVGVGEWSYVTGPVPAGSLSFNPFPPTSATVTVSGLTGVGTYVFRWTISNAPCGTSQSDVVITRLNDTPVANAGPDRLICTSSVVLTGNNPAPGVGDWSYVSGPSDPLLVTVNTSPTGLGTVSGLLEAGDHIFRYTITNGPCPSTTDEMLLRVTKPVVTPTLVQTEVRVCGQSVATVVANVPPFGTGVWSFVSSTNGDVASITTSGTAGTIGDITGMDLPGEYRFRYTVSNPPCVGSQSVDVRVIRDTPPSVVAFAGADQQLCDQDYTLLVGNVPPSGVTGVWERVSWPPLANPQVFGFGQFGSVVDMTEQGQYCFRYTFQTNTSCSGSSDLVCVQVWKRPTVANAGPSGSICTDQVTLTGNVPVIGTGQWSYVTGPSSVTPTIQSPTTNVSTMTGMNVAGTYVYRWTISNGVCTPSAFDVTVNVSEGTLGGTVTGAATVCSGSNSGTLVLTGSRGSVVEWQRSTDGFVTFAAIANTGLSQPYSNLTQNTCYRARVKDGACAEAFSSVECITVLDAPTVSNAGVSQTVCGTSTTLAGNSATSGTGVWSVVSAPAGSAPVFGSPNAGNSFVSGLTVAGDYLFRWTISNPPCGVSESSVLVRVTPAVSGGTVSGAATVCSGSNSGVVSLSGHQGSVLRWERSTNVSFSPSQVLSNTGLSQGYTNLTQTTYFRAVVGGGSCPETFSTPVEITVVPAAVANAGLDQSICAVSATVTGNVVPGYVGNWTIVTRPTGGGSTTVTTDALTGVGTLNSLVAGTYVLRWTLSGGSCGTVSDDVVLVVGTGIGGGTLSGSTTVCSGTNVGTLTVSGFSGSVVRWESALDAGFSQNLILHNNPTSSFTFFNLTATRYYRAVINGGGSCGTYEVGTGVVTVVGPAVNVTAGGSQTICESSVNLSGSVPVNGGVPTWTYVLGPEAPGNVLIANGGNGSASVTGLNALGNYLFRYSVDYGPCGVRTADVLVTRQASVNAGVVSGSTNVCSGVNSATLVLSGNNQAVIRWESSSDALFSAPVAIAFTGSSLVVSNLSATTYYRAVVQGPSCGPRFSTVATVTVDAPSVGGVVAGGTTVCTGTNGGSLVLSGNVGNVLRWERSTSALFTPAIPEPVTSNTFVYGNLSTTTWYRAVVKNGACAETVSSPVSVDVVGPSVGGTISGDLRVCSGNGSTVLTVSGFGCDVVRWESSEDGFVTVTPLNNPSATLVVSGLSSARAFRAVSACAPCAEAFSAAVIVTVDQPSVGGTISGPTTVCSGNNSGTLVLSGQVGSVVRWEYADNSAFAGATTVANVTTSQTFTNVSGTRFWRALVQNGSCSAVYSQSWEVAVNPSVSGGLVSGGTTVCGGINSGTLVLSGHSGTIQRWERASDALFTMGVQTLANTGTSQPFSNLSTTTWYRAVVGDGVCPSVPSGAAAVVVDAPPVAGVVSGASASCVSAAAGSLTLTGTVGTFVRWERATDANMTQNVTTLAPVNPLSYSEVSTAYYRAVVENGVCPAAFTSVAEIRVDQAPSGGSVSSAGPVCGNANSGSVVLSGQFGSVVRWESATDALFTQGLQVLSNTGVSQSYLNLNVTTYYRAVVRNGACPEVYSSAGVVTVNTAPVLTANAVVVCNGSGSVIARASGGSGGYVYTLNPGNVTNVSGDFLSVTPGSYTVSVVDGIGCGASQAVTVGTVLTPLVVNVVNITQTTAVATWPSAQSANAVYTLRYRMKGSGIWTTVPNLTTTFLQLTGLQNDTEYEVEVDYRCSPTSSPVGFGPTREFRTVSMGLCSQSPPNPVPVPGGVRVSAVNATSATVEWNAVADAAGYIVSWGIANTNPNGWPQSVVCNPTTQFTLTGLSPSNSYGVRVRTNCSNCTTASQSTDKRSDWSPTQLFTTLSSKSSLGTEDSEAMLRVYPNPNRGVFTVRWPVGREVRVEVLDASGRLVLTRSSDVGTDEVEVSVENSGLYLVRVTSGTRVETVKVIVE
jgi:hypothetical protein